MILLVHMLFGAATAIIIKNPYLAVILAFLGHYFLDFFPHIEYEAENINQKKWKKSLPDFLKGSLDITIGFLVIFIFSNSPIGGQAIIYLCAFVAILPDILSFIFFLFPNKFGKIYNELHQQKLHYLTHKKIPNFWRFFSQILVVIISLFVL